jgi:uncharacterized protein (TIGR02246 family)
VSQSPTDPIADLSAAVTALAARVQRLEDELAIHRVITRYGLAADVGNGPAAASTFTPDGLYDVDIGRLEGRAAIAAMLQSERHQGMVGHCAHQIGPAVVHELSGSRAIATGYSRVYLETHAGTHVYRVSSNRWELVKQDGAWLISRRTTRRLGHAETTAVLTGGVG